MRLAPADANPGLPDEEHQRQDHGHGRAVAHQGIAAASVRTIINKAGVNLGAITYHFGSKDNLVVEVFRRRMVPMTQERLAMLRGAKR